MRNNQRTLRANVLLALLLAGLCLVVPSAAPTQQARAANSLLEETPGMSVADVLVLRVYFRSNAERDSLAAEFGLESVSTIIPYLTTWADAVTLSSLRARGLRVEIDPTLTEVANRVRSTGKDEPGTFYGGYQTVEEMEVFLDRYVERSPILAEKIDIGDSWCKIHPGACTLPEPYGGYDIWALHISNRAIAGPKPIFWFDAGIHAREIATPEIAMRYITWLLDGYEANPDARWLVDYHDIWVVPMLNPDGHHIVEAGGGGNAPYLQRKTADNDDGCSVWPPTGFSHFGVDLNRNFPFKWGCCGESSGDPCAQPYRGTSPGSGEEGQAVRSRVTALIPDQRGELETDAAPITTTGIFQSLHSNGAIHLYPSTFRPQPVPNAGDMLNMANHMGALDAGGSGYPTCQPPGCYATIEGTTPMWAYGELGIPAFTTEISGDSFFPDYSYLDTIWNENREGLIYSAKIARMPYLTTRGPDAEAVTVEPDVVVAGATVHISATIDYAWTGNLYAHALGAAEYYVDVPPWAGGSPMAMQPSDGSFNSMTENVEANLDTGGLPLGRHMIFVRGRGTTSYEGYPSWGPVTAAFLNVVTGQPTATPTLEVSPTQTRTPTTPPTQTATTTPIQATPTITPVTCTVLFSDVPATNTFYASIRCLACRGIISGYSDGTFRPNNEVTRGQLAKIVSNSAGYTESPDPQIFEDVSPSNTFYQWINRLARRGHMSGYPCGGVGEPCVSGMPYFRPFANATRGQTSKIVSNAAGYSEIPVEQTFEDVPPTHTFYREIQRLASRNIMQGYPCGGQGEPCVSGRPYFRPQNNVTRGQSAKIVANTFFPDCITP